MNTGWEEGRDFRTGYRRAAIRNFPGWNASVRQTGQGVFIWSVGRQRTEAEGRDAHGSWWDTARASGTAPDYPAAKRAARLAFRAATRRGECPPC